MVFTNIDVNLIQRLPTSSTKLEDCMSQTAGSVLVQEQNNVLILTMSNPTKRNAIFPTLYAELTEALSQAQEIGRASCRESVAISGGAVRVTEVRRRWYTT